MGSLEDCHARQVYVLRQHGIVGRSLRSDLVLPYPQVSGQHASVCWNGEWLVKDLGSRNGTAVNGRKLMSGERAHLRAGDRLCFGCAEATFTVIDDDPPSLSVLRLDTGFVFAARQGPLQWSWSCSSSATLGESPDAGWTIEHQGTRLAVRDGQVVSLSGVAFRVFIPDANALEETTVSGGDVARLDHITLVFEVSRDEEHVQLTIAAPGRHTALPVRSFGYTLLALARDRLRDQAMGGLPDTEHGWVYADELARKLQMDLPRLNLDVFRARRQFEQAGIRDAPRVVERRATSRQIRLGLGSIRIQSTAVHQPLKQDEIDNSSGLLNLGATKGEE